MASTRPSSDGEQEAADTAQEAHHGRPLFSDEVTIDEPVVDYDRGEVFTQPAPKRRLPACSVETLIDRLDVVAAAYEPANG